MQGGYVIVCYREYSERIGFTTVMPPNQRLQATRFASLHARLKRRPLGRFP